MSSNFRIGVAGSGNGSVTLSGVSTNLSVAGQIRIDAGSTITNSGGANVVQTSSQPVLVNGLLRQITNNSADFNAINMSILSGGSYIQSTGRTVVSNTMLISGQSGTSTASSYSLQGTGISAGDASAQFITVGDSTNGTLILSGDATMTVTNSMTVNSGGLFDIRKNFGFDWLMTLNGGTVRAKDGPTLKTLTLFADAFLKGSGTVDGNLINDANVDPGLGFVGAFTLTGDYQQTAQGDLLIDLSGTSLSSYDNLDVTGDVVLGGVLDAQLVSGFMPAEGDRFDLISFDGSLTGTFSNVTLPTLSSGISMALVYGPNAVALTAGLDGDLNLDGFVGIEDLNIVLGNWNQTVAKNAWSLGDPTGDGFVGIEDLNKVLGNWNAGTPPSASVSVPEPTGIVWFCLGGVGVLMSARRIRPSSN